MPGYNLQPVEDFARLQSLTCPCCNYLLKEALQTEQGVRLCKSCYDDIQKYKDYKCPTSGLELEPNEPYHPDVAVRKEVDRLLVKCQLHHKGCSWQGSLKEHEDVHKKTCPVTCKACGEVLPAAVLEKHMTEDCPCRQVVCSDCGENMGYNELEEHQQNQCPVRIVECPNCQTSLCQSSLQEHLLRECTVQLCHICNTRVYKDSAEPVNIHEHLSNPADVFEHFQKLGWQQQSTMEDVGKLEKSRDAIETDMQQNRKEFDEYKMTITKGIDSVQERIQHLERTGDKGVPAEVTNTIRDLKEKVDRHEKVLVSPLQGGGYTSNQSAQGSSAERLMQVEKKVEEVERQTAMVKVSVSELELQLQASLASTYNGAFLWRIPDVKKRRRDAIDSKITSIYSPPFYTGRNGYKMCIRAYLNGDGIGYDTHLSIFFVLMKGEYDPLLKWPFDYKVSLILVDQNHRRHIVQTFKPSPSSNSFKQPVQDMNVASGCPKFTELSVLDNDDYIKDDVMYIKCIVDTTRIFHP